MKMSRMQWLLWISLSVLSALLVLSVVRDAMGVDTFHEVTCDEAQPGHCGLSGRYIVLLRKPGDASANPPRTPELAVETYSANGLLESHLDQVRCVMPDPSNVVCRDLLTAVASGARSKMAPWRVVQGRLVNDGVDPNRVRYLDSLALWRNRLTLSNYER